MIKNYCTHDETMDDSMKVFAYFSYKQFITYQMPKSFYQIKDYLACCFSAFHQTMKLIAKEDDYHFGFRYQILKPSLTTRLAMILWNTFFRTYLLEYNQYFFLL